jgi:hypothetical protein
MVGETMKIKKREVIVAFQAMSRISNLPIQPRCAYWMSRNFNNLIVIYKKIEESQNEIIKKYGTKDEKTGQISVPQTIKKGEEEILNPVIEVVTKAISEMVEEEVDVEINKVNLAGFTGQISLGDMNAISFMIEEDVTPTILTLPKRIM